MSMNIMMMRRTVSRLCSIRHRHTAHIVPTPFLAKRALSVSSSSSSSSSSNNSAQPAASVSVSATATAGGSSTKYSKTSAGTGDPGGLGATDTNFSTRGPVTWPALGLVSVVAASAVAYYKIERERRLENAMGKIVSFVHIIVCFKGLNQYYLFSSSHI